MNKILLAVIFLAASPLFGAEASKISFSGQLRWRGESTNIEGYGTAAKRRGLDSSSQRIRLGAAVDAGSDLKGLIQLQDSRNWGSEASVAANTANIDLHQGYADVLSLFDSPLDLRLGRMELQYGDQRLVSPLDWHNVGRAWDGARVRWKGGNGTIDAFNTVVKEVGVVKRQGNFWGIYASGKNILIKEADVYLLGRDHGDMSYLNEVGTRGNLSDRTVGLRLKDAPGDFEYTGEAAWQFGRKAGQRVRAWGMAATGVYTLALPLKPRVGLEYDFASGDANPNDNQVQTFDPLYPFGHFYQGHQDIFSWKNGHDFKAAFSLDPKPDWRLSADFHHFRLHRTLDAWYDATGSQIVRSASSATGTDIGNELDLYVKGKFRDAVSLWFGYSRFFAGSFVRSNTPRQDRDWLFFQAALNFSGPS